MKEQHLKILITMVLVSICLVSKVDALGLGPLKLDITIEKGKETELVEYIGVLNPETKPIHVTASVTGPIAEFVTLDPQEFDMPAGPGIGTGKPRPAQDVKVIFKIPRELPENKYTGEIVFTQQPVEGGVLGAAVQLGVKIDMNIGKMAAAEFPTYIIGLAIVLIVVLISSIVVTMMRRYRE